MTMRGPEPSPQQEQDLEAFLRTLPPPPPLARAVDAAQRDAIDRGKAVFGRLACAGCHAPPLYTTPKVYDVGLSDEAGKKLFNPPSLRGVAHGGPFFHDGRAPTLEAVFTQHHHQIKEDMSKADRDDLLRFLRSL
jgi:CxxC motif-containing protein (DUF1111 family)